MKTFLKYVLLYILLTVLMLGSLFLVSFIPKEAIRKNARRTALTLYYEGEKVYFNSLGRKLYDDNSSDAIMFNLTYTIDEDNKLESIIKARRNFLPGITKEIKSDSVGDLPHESITFSMTREFLNTVEGKEQTAFEYGRYWHGYIVVLRILLCLFDVTVIRLLTQLTIIILLILLMYYLAKNNNWKLSVALFLGFVATDLFTWTHIIHGKYVAVVALFISVFVANKKINKNNFNIWLFVSGALTAYLDLLTTPILSALLPIIIFAAVNNEESNFKDQLIRFTKNLTAWGVGYFGLWLTKWVISDLFYGTDIIKVSLTQIYYRVFGINNDDGIEINNIESLSRNIIMSANYLVAAIYILTLGWAVIKKIHSRKKGIYLSSNKLPYYACFIITFAWYFIISEHSHKHYFFTYKTMLIPLIATTFIVLDNKEKNNLIEEKDVKND